MRIIFFTVLAFLLPLEGGAQEDTECTIAFKDDAVSPPSWLNQFHLCDPIINAFIQRRVPGLVFYEAPLAELAQLKVEEQLRIIEAVQTDGIGERNFLEQELAIPVLLIEAVVAEADANGADSYWDIPAFVEVLNELKSTGMTESGDTFADLRELAPVSSGQIFFVAAREQAEQRLVDAEGRLVDAEGRLVDAEEQLSLAKELERTTDEVSTSAQGLMDQAE